MPAIRPSADLRNDYNNIIDYCKKTNNPVFITKNGHGDAVILSMESYDNLCSKYGLYRLIDEGIKDVENGDIMPYEDAIKEIVGEEF